jgi:hypothetical protein
MVQAAKCSSKSEDKFFALVDAWDPHEPWDPPAYYTRHYLPIMPASACIRPMANARSTA